MSAPGTGAPCGQEPFVELFLIDRRVDGARLAEWALSAPVGDFSDLGRLPDLSLDRLMTTANGALERSALRHAARIALRQILATRLPEAASRLRFMRLPGGALGVDGADRPVAVSVSYSAPFALLAVAIGAEGAIGCDIERWPRRIRMSDSRAERIVRIAAAFDGSRKAFAVDRCLAIGSPTTTVLEDASSLDARACAAWTVLEATAKARGSGIGALLTALGIRAGAERSGPLVWPDWARHLKLAHGPVANVGFASVVSPRAWPITPAAPISSVTPLVGTHVR